MSEALEKLAQLVLKAETKAKSEQIEADIEKSTSRLATAEEQNREVHAELQSARKHHAAIAEETEIAERHLKELTKKSAEFKNFLDECQQVEALIAQAKEEISAKRAAAQQRLDAAAAAAEKSLKELFAAREVYERARTELDRLQPQLIEQYASGDRLMSKTAIFFPPGELRALQKEIDDIAQHFGGLSQREQFAQMKIWIGRYRRLMTQELPEEEYYKARVLFPELVGISKQHKPGYIEAFQESFEADWDLFIAEAEAEMRAAIDERQRRAEAEHKAIEQRQKEEEERRRARDEAQGSLDRLRQIIATRALPEEGGEEFKDSLLEVIQGFGASDEMVLRLVFPFRELLDGSDFRALRRNLDRLAEESNGQDEPLGEEHQELLGLTRGRKALLIGGSRREDARRQLETLFEFGKLEWEDYEGNRPAALKSLEQRVRNQSLDLVLILKGFVSHHVTEKLRPLCEQSAVPCFLVEHGYGARQVAQALRRGLPH